MGVWSRYKATELGWLLEVCMLASKDDMRSGSISLGYSVSVVVVRMFSLFGSYSCIMCRVHGDSLGEEVKVD